MCFPEPAMFPQSYRCFVNSFQQNLPMLQKISVADWTHSLDRARFRLDGMETETSPWLTRKSGIHKKSRERILLEGEFQTCPFWGVEGCVSLREVTLHCFSWQWAYILFSTGDFFSFLSIARNNSSGRSHRTEWLLFQYSR